MEDGTTLIVEHDGKSLRAPALGDRLVEGFRWLDQNWIWTGQYDGNGFPTYRSLNRGEHLIILDLEHHILKVIPEPSRALLVMFGLIAGCCRRRRQSVPQHPAR